MISHGGGIFGFISANAYFPDDTLSVTVLANASPSQPERLLRSVARVALGLPLPATAGNVALTAAERARYVGTYTLQLPTGTLPIRIFEQGDRLQAQAQGQGAFDLIPRGGHAFGTTVDPSIRLVFAVEGDRVTRLTLHQGGATMEGPRAP